MLAQWASEEFLGKNDCQQFKFKTNIICACKEFGGMCGMERVCMGDG